MRPWNQSMCSLAIIEEMNYYFYRGNIYEAIEDYERALEDYLFVTETVKIPTRYGLAPEGRPTIP